MSNQKTMPEGIQSIDCGFSKPTNTTKTLGTRTMRFSAVQVILESKPLRRPRTPLHADDTQDLKAIKAAKREGGLVPYEQAIKGLDLENE